jgi:Phage integrase family
VFPAPEGGYLRRSNFRRRWWLRATRAAGVEGLRFHDLRHSAATLALAAGANTRELMERMGHTSPQVALRYQHVMAGRDQAIAAALDELVQAAATLPPERPAEAPSGTLVHETDVRRVAPRPGRRGSAVDLDCFWSGRPDLNRRPPAPKAARAMRRAEQGKCRSLASGNVKLGCEFRPVRATVQAVGASFSALHASSAAHSA